MADDSLIDLRPAPQEVDVDAREQYTAFLETSKKFLGVPGGGVKVLAALIELFDELLKKAPQDTQEAFWALVQKKLDTFNNPMNLAGKHIM